MWEALWSGEGRTALIKQMLGHTRGIFITLTKLRGKNGT